MKGLDDRFGATTGTLATQPAAYKPGTLAAIANGYEDAGEADKADSARRMALQESFLRSFATSNVSAQQRLTESLPEGEDRTSAEAIQRRQTEAFAQDPFTAGTALYPDVGPPKPINELAGRIAQARTIAAYRSIPVAPFTANELATLRQKLVDGTPQERAALLAQLDALPEDMNAAIIPARTMSDAVDESRREGDQLAEATPEDFREIGPPPRRGAAPVIEPSPGSPEFEAATDEARKITTKRGVAPPVEPAPDSLEFQTAMTKAVGHPVVLPDGSRVPDPTSDTGNLMSPEPDLRAVAEAGRKAGEQYRALIDNPETADGATAYLAITAGLNVGQGGSFDYQREGNHITGFEQLPHFRNVSNFNVGLFCQQAGLTLDETLKVAGKFARMFSRNYDPSQPYGLNKQTAEFTTRGFKTGESGVFDRTNPP